MSYPKEGTQDEKTPAVMSQQVENNKLMVLCIYNNDHPSLQWNERPYPVIVASGKFCRARCVESDGKALVHDGTNRKLREGGGGTC